MRPRTTKIRLLASTVLLLFCSCENQSISGPNSLLYRRWHLLQARDVNEASWTKHYLGIHFDIEYRPDGTLVYRRDGVVVPTPCCSASRYEVDSGLVIRYQDAPGCPSVRCAGLTDGIIRVLRGNLLEIQVGSRIMQYEPAK